MTDVKARFAKASEAAKLAQADITAGISTYGEKTLHRVLKYYYCEDPLSREVKVGNYIVDGKEGDLITEIQTRSFDKLRPKLDFLLQEYRVRIVFPISEKKTILWIDPKTGETEERRKSPKKGNVYDVAKELYKIKKYLKNKNLMITLVKLETEEKRFMDGWGKRRKKGFTRYDIIPVSLKEEIPIADFSLFMPVCDRVFTSRQYAKAAGIGLKTARTMLNILVYLKVARITSKQGRMNLYEYAQ